MRLIDADALRVRLDTEVPCFHLYQTYNKEDVIRAVMDAPTIGGWVSIKDRLPETGRLALVYGSAGAMTIARYIANNEWLVPGIFSTVTHWMPLPEPPEEAEENE